MSKPHKHAELITAIAQGKQMQRKLDDEFWADCTADAALYRLGMNMPTRIKPEPKPDVAFYLGRDLKGDWFQTTQQSARSLMLITQCGETGKLKSAEVV